MAEPNPVAPETRLRLPTEIPSGYQEGDALNRILDRRLKRLEELVGFADDPPIQIVSADDLPGTSIVLVNCKQTIGTHTRPPGIAVIVGGAEPDITPLSDNDFCRRRNSAIVSEEL
jgi:hypothetical protein